MFSLAINFSGADLSLFRRWTKEATKSVATDIADGIKLRISKSLNVDGDHFGYYKTNRGRKAKNRLGKPIILYDTGRMLKTFRPRKVVRTRALITTLADYDRGVHSRYKWSWIDPETHRVMVEKVEYYINVIILGNQWDNRREVWGDGVLRVSKGAPVAML